jgi:hypothetical protein
MVKIETLASCFRLFAEYGEKDLHVASALCGQVVNAVVGAMQLGGQVTPRRLTKNF